ncbi:hypothetical protein ACWDUH_12155 [Micromonospora wenchangensis]
MSESLAGEVVVLRAELRQLLDRAERWLDGIVGSGIHFEDSRRSALTESLHGVRALRTRAVSNLLTVAFLGQFSSGKSFLIGGLQERLEHLQVAAGDGLTAEQYLGLLHSAAQPVNACPAVVVPVEAGAVGGPDSTVSRPGEAFYRVRFVESSAWEDLGWSPAPAVVAAYTTQDSHTVVRGREPAHRGLTVAEVEVLLPDAALPAKLYELPGMNSVYAVHDQIANDAWMNADCFVYVSQATHTLTRQEAELIGRLYRQHASTGRPVIWALTGIDRAASVDFDGEPQWKAAVEANNAYLTENFPPPAGGVDTFQGEGFVAVSPAWEAKGRWHLTRGEVGEGRGLIAASRMDTLRRSLRNLIEANTGRSHLAAVAVEARGLLLSHQRMLIEILEYARTPLDQLSTELAGLHARLETLRAAISVTRERLEVALNQHVRVTDRRFDGLAELLRMKLADDIAAANLADEETVNRLEARKAQVIQEWVTRGPQQVWEKRFQEFSDDVLGAVRLALNDTRGANLGPDTARLDIADLSVTPSARYRPTQQDWLQHAAGVVSLSTPVLTVLATLVGAGTAVAVLPAGVAVVAGVLYTYLARNRKRSAELHQLRQRWLEDLDTAADEYRESFVALAHLCGTAMIGRAMEILTERTEEIVQQIVLVQGRLEEPGLTDLSGLVAGLDPQVRAGAEILEGLRGLTGRE